MLPISPRFFVLLFGLITCFYQSVASVSENEFDGDSIAVVSRVVISGNNITKERVITRELMFEQGDTIDLVIWDRILSRSRENLMNLGIFNFVDVTAAKDPGAGYTVLVNVVERWYILPLPRFELVDRNFNEWVRSGELGRFNYGLDLDWSNFRGMNESLKFQFKWGYTRKISLSYQIPYINSNQEEGLSFFGSYTASKEIGYGVDNSKLLLYDAVDGYA
ncbi:MAG: POTRA domain-containing protein, partial [Bacteroidota bacterium]